MEYTTLGRTALKVSRLCLGTMNFGWKTEPPESHAVMDKALELGVNFFDTADVYGWGKGPGWTEEIIGQWLAKGGRRDRIVLATKVYNKMGEGVNDKGLSAWHIVRGCEASLKRLQTDRIDLYQMHHVDRSAPWDEIYQATDQLVRQGKVIYVGSSNFAGWHVATACQEAQRRGLLGLVSEQSLYNLTARSIELEVLPACKHYGLGVIAWSPLAGGLLGGMASPAQGPRRQSEGIQKQLQKHADRVPRYEDFCSSLGEKPAHVALAWLLSNPVVTAPIIGPRTLEQLAQSLRALEIKLDAEALKKLDEIWPGPGGPAPEAYAW